MSIDTYNGYILNGKLIPDTILETLLTYVDVTDLLKLREVCQVWRDILSCRIFWKTVAQRNGIDWSLIPDKFKESEISWPICYAACRHNIFSRNFISNHSGHDGFSHWERLSDPQDSITIEIPPLSIEPLPKDPDYNGETDSAFVFSNEWGILQQQIELRKIGITKHVLKAMTPFQFTSTQIIGTRDDSAASYCVCMCLLDEDGEAILFNMTDDVIPAEGKWKKFTSTLTVPHTCPRLNDAKYVALMICGRTTEYRIGYLGTKFARNSLSLKCLSIPELHETPPHLNNVQNPNNAHIFIGKFWYKLLPNRQVRRCPYHRYQ